MGPRSRDRTSLQTYLRKFVPFNIKFGTPFIDSKLKVLLTTPSGKGSLKSTDTKGRDSVVTRQLEQSELLSKSLGRKTYFHKVSSRSTLEEVLLRNSGERRYRRRRDRYRSWRKDSKPERKDP